MKRWQTGLMAELEGVQYSVIVPVYGNADTLSELVDTLVALSKILDDAMEAVFVVDGSPDNSLSLLQGLLSESRLCAQLITHSRNFGAFPAIRTGLAAARGDYVAVMAADLQEPPELCQRFFDALGAGEADVVVGRREGRNDPTSSSAFSAAYWRFYTRFVVRDIPAGGVDIFACTSEVAEHLLALSESHTSLVSQLYWVGFRRLEVPYERRARTSGRSGWTFRKKATYMLDSIFAFTNIPITLVIAVGLVSNVLTAIASLAVLVAWAAGAITVPGYTPLMLVVLLSTTGLMTAIGVVGLYVWRTFENTKGRPATITMRHEFFERVL